MSTAKTKAKSAKAPAKVRDMKPRNDAKGGLIGLLRQRQSTDQDFHRGQR